MYRKIIVSYVFYRKFFLIHHINYLFKYNYFLQEILKIKKYD